MRVSTDKNDSGYVKDASGYKAYLSGTIIEKCITADDILGVAIIHETDSEGNIIIDGIDIKRKKIHGKITIKKSL